MSNINPNLPIAGTPTTASVRGNFATAKAEIEQLEFEKASAVDFFAHLNNIQNPHQVTAAQAGADVAGAALGVQLALDSHEADIANPHQVTALQAAADPAGSAAAVQANLGTHEADIANPHQVSPAQIGAAVILTGTGNLLIPYAVSTTQNLAHGLGVAPNFFNIYLICLIGELGYAAGDLVLLPTTAPLAAGGNAYTCSANTVITTIATSASLPSIVRKDTNVPAQIIAARWALLMVPYIIAG